MSEQKLPILSVSKESTNSNSTLTPISSSVSTNGWKEGTLCKREKGIIRYNWKEKFIILLEGSLFFYQTHRDLTPKGVIHLSNCQVIELAEKKIKKKFAFSIHNSGTDYYFCATNEEEKLDWMSAITAALSKGPASPPDKEFAKKTKPSSVYVSGRLIDSITSFGASGKIAKEFITADTEVIVDSFKSFLSQYLGNDKACKIEKQSISIAIKIAMLYREKHITREYFESTIVPIRLLISKLIDGYEIPFTFNAHEVVENLRQVQKSLEKILRPYLHEKTINKMNQTFDMICDEDLIGDFYEKRKWKECETVGTTLRKLWDAGAF